MPKIHKSLKKQKRNKYKKKRNYNQMFEENNKVINKNCEKNRGNQNSVKFNIQLKEDTSNNNNINLIKNLEEINEFDNCPTDNIIEKNENKRKTNLHIYQIILENNREISNNTFSLIFKYFN